MRKFLLWDQDGVLVDTERWFFVATQECLRELGVVLDQVTYLQFMAVGRSYWDLALEHGQPEAVIAAKRRERDRRYHAYLASEAIEIDGVLETLRALCLQAPHGDCVDCDARRCGAHSSLTWHPAIF